jgi:hypothetical protein
MMQTRKMFQAGLPSVLFVKVRLVEMLNNGIQAMTWSRRFVVVLSSRLLGFDVGSAHVGCMVDKPARR